MLMLLHKLTARFETERILLPCQLAQTMDKRNGGNI